MTIQNQQNADPNIPVDPNLDSTTPAPSNDGFDPSVITDLKEDITSLKDLIYDAMNTDSNTPNNQPSKEVVESVWDELDKNPPKSYKELGDIILKEVDKAQAVKEARIKEDQEKQEKEKKQRMDVLNKRIDQDIEILEKQGKLPKIQNPLDENDPGVKVRVELFKEAADLGTADLIKVYEKVIAPRQTNQTTPKQKPAGANAPVGGPGGGNNNQYQGTREYKSLKVPLEEARRKYFPEG